MFRRRNTLTYQSTAVFWREVLSAHNRTFQGCSSFQLLTKRLWPRAVPWARIKILSNEMVSANRLAYPSGRRDQSRDPREKATTKKRSLRTTRRKRDVFCGALKCAQRVREPSFLGEENWERKCLGKTGSKRTVDCPIRDRNAIRRRASSNFAFLRCHRRYVASHSTRFHSCHREDRTEYRKNVCICVYISCRGAEIFEWNKIESRLTKSCHDTTTADYDRSPCEIIDRSINAIAISRSMLTLFRMKYNAGCDIVSPRETETSHMREESCVAISYSEI